MGIIGDAYCKGCDKTFRACYGVDDKRDLVEVGISMEHGNIYACPKCDYKEVYFIQILMWID